MAPKAKKEEKKNVAAISLDPPSGTRDFFPQEMRHQRWLFNKFREVAHAYGFSEYDAPVLEHEELYKRKAGEEITQQMYNFVDKEDAKVTLRPEMTPSLARMVLSLMRAETGEMAVVLPLKWYSIPQCWRFETTQRGRKREHYQWNMDIVGVPGITAEVELLSAICTFFESIGITHNDIGLKINSRKVLGAVVKKAGVPDERFAETCVIIDKLDKIGAEEVRKELAEKVGLSQEVGKKITDALAARTWRSSQSAQAWAKAPRSRSCACCSTSPTIMATASGCNSTRRWCVASRTTQVWSLRVSTRLDSCARSVAAAATIAYCPCTAHPRRCLAWASALAIASW